MRVVIFGSGYVGLVTGACFAEVGNKVVCVDIDEAKVARLTSGECPIYEPGLEEMLAGNLKRQNLSFTTSPEDALSQADIAFIAVGTPTGEDGSSDLQYVLAVAQSIGQEMSGSLRVVMKSTVPVGTSRLVKKTIQEELTKRDAKLQFSIISNPEFLKEGSALGDFMKPDRVVVGIEKQSDEVMMRKLYGPFNRNHDVMIFMDVASSELTKYAANCMLATKISFINEMAQVADKLGANIDSVRAGIGSDSRIGYQFLYPGSGYGGSCFPKDVKALIATGKENSLPMHLMQSVEQVNALQKQWLVGEIAKFYEARSQSLNNKKICLWGLSFKPNTDDMREAPSRVVLDYLLAAGSQVSAYDPKAMEECKHIYGSVENLHYAKSAKEALTDCDALVIVTEWREFQSFNLQVLRDSIKDRVIFDGRNLFAVSEVAEIGIEYVSVGRPCWDCKK